MIFLAKSLVAIGLIEDMSITSVPGFSPSATPSGAEQHVSTSGVSGTIRITTSDFAATALPSGTTSATASDIVGQAGAVGHHQVVLAGMQVQRHGAAHDARGR